LPSLSPTQICFNFGFKPAQGIKVDGKQRYLWETFHTLESYEVQIKSHYNLTHTKKKERVKEKKEA
jgi:hypothetical protein